MIQYPSINEIHGNWPGAHIISMNQFSPENLEEVYQLAMRLKPIYDQGIQSNIITGKNLVGLGFESSTRTLLSFYFSALQLGTTPWIEKSTQEVGPEFRGRHIDQVDENAIQLNGSSQQKGESFRYTIEMYGIASDILAIRHPCAGAPLKVIDSLRTSRKVSVWNLGDGIGEHPTQGVLDLCTLRDRFGRFSDLKGVVIGDARNARTIHSLLRGLALFKENHVCLLSPQGLGLPKEDIDALHSQGLDIDAISDPSQIPNNCDFCYIVRAQRERDPTGMWNVNYTKIDLEFIERYLGQAVIMHPMPIVDEVDSQVDEHPHAIYSGEQVRMGYYTRMALLTLVLDRLDLVTEISIPR